MHRSPYVAAYVPAGWLSPPRAQHPHWDTSKEELFRDAGSPARGTRLQPSPWLRACRQRKKTLAARDAFLRALEISWF